MKKTLLSPATFHVLISVAEEEKHGYGIMQEVAERTGGTLRLGPGTLYRTLQKMLEEGLILETEVRRASSPDDERRRYYRITPLGRRAAQAETARLAELVKQARASGFARGKA